MHVPLADRVAAAVLVVLMLTACTLGPAVRPELPAEQLDEACVLVVRQTGLSGDAAQAATLGCQLGAHATATVLGARVVPRCPRPTE